MTATSAPSWRVKGRYFETCSCDYLCPCSTSNLAAKPTKGECTFAFVFNVEDGQFGETKLDGLKAAVIGRAPGEMINGSWSVGVITDERATPEQQQALVGIISGQAGGPMAGLSRLITNFLGVESKPIQFQGEGMQWSVSIPGVLDQAVEGVPSPVKEGEPLYIDNTIHPVNPRLALAKAQRSHVSVFGLKWDDTSGNNNGHFAPFNWSSS